MKEFLSRFLKPLLTPADSDKPASRADALWKQLENAIVLATKQDQIVWTIFGVFWAAEAVLLAALFQSGEPPKGYVGPVVSIAGIAISKIWKKIQHRALGWLDAYEGVVNTLEKKLKLEPEVCITIDPQKVKGEPVRDLMRSCPQTCVKIWYYAGIFFTVVWVWEVIQKFPKLTAYLLTIPDTLNRFR